MRLTRLEIFGFKSFVERFALHFDQNLIGIVGPNGCGKSNVVDALRWVLGETQAKQLRGGKQEDLIFNGSDARRALGMAEVSITIRPSEHWATQAFEQQDELERLLSAVEREENSEPAVDSGEKSQETAAQGRAEASATPSALQASASPPHPQKTHQHGTGPASQPLVQGFLAELPGLLNASEIQFTRRLYRSGESEYMINRVPCRLRDMVEIYRYIGLGSRGLNIVQQGQIGELISKKPVERRELLEEAAGISGFRAKLEAAQRKLTKTHDNLARIRDIEIEVEKQVRVLKRQATRAKMRNELKSELQRIEFDWYAGRGQLIAARRAKAEFEQHSLEDASNTAQASLREAEARFTASQAELEHQDQQLFSLRRERDQWTAVVKREQERLQGFEMQLVRFETESESIEGQRGDLDEREAKSTQELERRRQEKLDIEEELRQFREQHERAEESLSERREEVARELAEIETQIAQRLLNNESDVSQSDLDRLQQEISNLEQEIEASRTFDQELRDCKRERAAVRSELEEHRVRAASLRSEQQTLEKQRRALADHVVRATSAEQSGELLSTLASGLIVAEEYERAVHAALGDKGSFVVSPSAKQLAEQFLSKPDAERNVCIGVLDNSGASPKPLPLTMAEREAASSARLLLDCIEVDQRVRVAAEQLLSSVVLVDSMTEALTLREVSEQRETIVTLAGEVITPWGWFTTSGSSVDFSVGRRLEELSELLADAEQRTAATDARLKALAEREETLSQASDELARKRQQSSELRKRINELLQQERRQREAFQQEIRREEKRLRDAAMQREREAQEQLHRAANEVSRRVSQIAFIEERIFVLGSDLAQFSGQRERLSAREEEIASQVEDVQSQLAAPGEELERAQGKVREFDEQLQAIEESRQGIASTHAQLAQEVSECRRSAEAAAKRSSQASLEVERAGLELDMLKEEAETSYGSDAIAAIEQAISDSERAPVDTDALRSEALALRKRLEREGEVDPESIERYEEESARLELLRTQSADLEQAVRILEKTIKRLKELSRERFLETFKDVSQRFAQLVPRLFGGGAGHMELVDPEDPLMSGVEISVRPPGKKLSSMELLSGGEKALVATAVLVAMFLHRPSPICVLDEVDAPLDEANLDRFISLVSEISASTQFLIITHNKATMSAMGRLVGITMQERGVSTALSVTLDEAEEELDRWVANA